MGRASDQDLETSELLYGRVPSELGEPVDAVGMQHDVNRAVLADEREAGVPDDGGGVERRGERMAVGCARDASAHVEVVERPCEPFQVLDVGSRDDVDVERRLGPAAQLRSHTPDEHESDVEGEEHMPDLQRSRWVGTLERDAERRCPPAIVGRSLGHPHQVTQGRDTHH